jgi:hypothetical protein
MSESVTFEGIFGGSGAVDLVGQPHGAVLSGGMLADKAQTVSLGVCTSAELFDCVAVWCQ